MTTSNTSETEETQGPRWYIVHTYSGQEDLVEKNLRLRIQSLDMQDRINEVLVPTEEEVVFKDGQRKSERKKLFPGYILVQMTMDDESWYAVRTTRVNIGLERGETVRITEGPFVDFIGSINDVDEGKGKVRVMVSFFGRETPVELDFLQVERI